MTAKKKRSYSGILAKPRPTGKDAKFTDDEYDLLGMMKLIEHYHIQSSPGSNDVTPMLVGLVLELARDNDELRFFKRGGGGRRKDLRRSLGLELEVAREMASSGVSKTKAIKRLASRKPIPGSPARGMGEDALRKQLQRSGNEPFVQILKRIALGQRMPDFSDDQLLEWARELGQIKPAF